MLRARPVGDSERVQGYAQPGAEHLIRVRGQINGLDEFFAHADEASVQRGLPHNVETLALVVFWQLDAEEFAGRRHEIRVQEAVAGQFLAVADPLGELDRVGQRRAGECRGSELRGYNGWYEINGATVAGHGDR